MAHGFRCSAISSRGFALPATDSTAMFGIRKKYNISQRKPPAKAAFGFLNAQRARNFPSPVLFVHIVTKV